MPELERLIADALPDWPAPPAGAEDRILGGLGLREPPRGPAAWLRRAPRSRRLRLLAAVALLAGSGAAIAVALTGGGPATGAPHASLDFGPPQAIGPASPYLGGASLAVDATGTVTAAWSYAGRVFAASRPRGGAWSAAERLSDPSVRALRPQVAAGPAGRAVIVWRERSPGRVVRRAFTLPGGAPAGTLETRVDERWRVLARVRERGAWSAPEAVSPPTGAMREVHAPQVVMSRNGDALTSFTRAGRVWIVARPAAGSWVAPVPISPRGGFPADLRLVAEPASGRVLATWSLRRDDPTAGRSWQVWAATRDPGAGWDARAVGGPGVGKPFSAGAIDGRGRAVVAWFANGAWAATRAESGDWSAAERLPTPRRIFPIGSAAAGVDGAGLAVVAVPHRGGSSVLARPSAGDWRPVLGPDRHSASGSRPTPPAIWWWSLPICGPAPRRCAGSLRAAARARRRGCRAPYSTGFSRSAPTARRRSAAPSAWTAGFSSSCGWRRGATAHDRPPRRRPRARRRPRRGSGRVRRDGRCRLERVRARPGADRRPFLRGGHGRRPGWGPRGLVREARGAMVAAGDRPPAGRGLVRAGNGGDRRALQGDALRPRRERAR